jgi:hypothetical protein
MAFFLLILIFYEITELKGKDREWGNLIWVWEKINLDGFVKSPISAPAPWNAQPITMGLCCILHHCGVGQLRLIPQDLHALILNIFQNRLNSDFLRDHQP